MNASQKALQILQKFNVLTLNGVDVPQRGRAMPRNAVRRVASPGESTTIVRDKKPWYYHRLYCSHDHLWQHYCSRCGNLGITAKDREQRAQDAITWLMQQNLAVRSV